MWNLILHFLSNCTLFFPIIIALIAGYIITREYTDDTMKNISTIPIPYKQLLSGKLLVLLLLTIIFSLIAVSYTHLDVYKRQSFHPSKAGTADRG